MYKLVFFVPESHLESVKSAVFATGAGQLGDYEHCCWQTLGQGQFRPLSGSRPYLGDIGQLTYVAEYRVELLCAAHSMEAAITALCQSHPYQQPAYDIVQLVNFDHQ